MSNKRIQKKRAKRGEYCPICGKRLFAENGKYITGTDRTICKACLQAVRNTEESAPSTYSYWCPFDSPSEVLEELDKRIIGQEKAKRAIVMALWKQVLRTQGEDIPNASLLLYGPTGCGKTALVREAAGLLNVPFLSFDATSLSETGYRGRDAAEMVTDLVNKYGSAYRAAYGVIFLDEVDKLAADKGNEYRGSFCRGTQFSLLKLIEGLEVETPKGKVNTKNILFLFGGAFSGLTNREDRPAKRTIGFLREETPAVTAQNRDLRPVDFVAYGMEPELMGRVGRCVGLEALTEEQLRAILLGSHLSVFRMYQRYFRQRGKDLVMDDVTMSTLIHEAINRGMGARGLNSLVEEWIEPQLKALVEQECERSE